MTFLILFAPFVLLVLWWLVRLRIQRRKALVTQGQIPEPNEKPYDPKPQPQPGQLLRSLSLPQRVYLRQQMQLARIGFVLCLWIFLVLLMTPLLPGQVAEKYLPTLQQRAWYSFVNGATLWSSGIPIMCGLAAAMLAGAPLVSGTARFLRTRPLSLRFVFWARVLPAAGALLLAALLSISLSFATLRIAYGPAWNSIPQTHSVTLGTHHALLNVGDDETPMEAAERRLHWIASCSPVRIFLSAVTGMMLVFASLLTVFCQTFFGGTFKPQSLPKWVIGISAVGFATFVHLMNDPAPFRFGPYLFYNSPWQPPPAWHFLPVPIVLTLALLLCSERLFLRRDV